MDSLTDCAGYCRRWFAISGVPYDPRGRETFARAHPSLFGTAYEVTLRGYERWLVRANVMDDIDAFGAYLAGRFQRALSGLRHEFLVYEVEAQPEDIEQMVQCALIDEH